MRGFIDYVWTPVTVIQLVDLMHATMTTDVFDTLRRTGPVVHFAPNAALSKFDYLTALRRFSGRGASVEQARSPARFLPSCARLISCAGRAPATASAMARRPSATAVRQERSPTFMKKRLAFILGIRPDVIRAALVINQLRQ